MYQRIVSLEDTVTSDAILRHELDSLHERLRGLSRKRRSQTPDRPAPNGADRHEKTKEAHGLHAEIMEFIKLIANFADEAKESASAHPSASTLGAMIVGILIGRLLGRH
jgi:hypothetical protein